MSILTRGIIHVTGEHDTGKTSFALECGAHPSKICMVDDDVKGRGTIEQLTASGLTFGAYHDFVSLTKKGTELDRHNFGLSIIDSIKEGQFDVIIWDTWTRMGRTCHKVILENPSRFRKHWAKMGKIKGAEQWQEAADYEAALIAAMAQKAPLIILVTHLRDHYRNNVKTGKLIPASSKTLNRVPNMRLWLRHNPHSPVPIGLLLKRLDVKKMTDQGLRTVCVTPRRITPMPGEQSLWDAIARYLDSPVGDRELTPEEQPTSYELSILDGTLTEDQKLAWRAGVADYQSELAQEKLTRQHTLTMADILGTIDIIKAKELRAAGKSPMDIAKELDCSVPEVLRALKS